MYVYLPPLGRRNVEGLSPLQKKPALKDLQPCWQLSAPICWYNVKRQWKMWLNRKVGKQGHEHWPTLPSEVGTNDISVQEVESSVRRSMKQCHSLIKQGIAVIRGSVFRVDAWCEKKTGIAALPYFNFSTQRLEILHTTVSKKRLGICIRSRVKGRLRNHVLHSIEQSTRKRVSDYPCTNSLPDSNFQSCFSLLKNLSMSSVVPKRTSKV